MHHHHKTKRQPQHLHKNPRLANNQRQPNRIPRRRHRYQRKAAQIAPIHRCRRDICRMQILN